MGLQIGYERGNNGVTMGLQRGFNGVKIATVAERDRESHDGDENTRPDEQLEAISCEDRREIESNGVKWGESALKGVKLGLTCGYR